jgi:SPP1 gp7 family putative phage head morphogenesis protein
MDINDRLYNRIVEHMTDVRLYEEGLQLQNRRILRRHRENLAKLLKADLKNDITKEANRFAKELNAHLTTSVTEFSTAQLSFHADNFYKDVKDFYRIQKPNTKNLLDEIIGPTMKGEKTLTKNIVNISSGELVRIQTKVKAGLAKGTPPKEIISEVLKTTKLTEAQASTLTRTSITSTQNAAVNSVVQNNKGLVKGYLFSAILDSRTSPICSYHNGNLYAVDDLRFKPPLHWNCRSTLIPVLKSKTELLATEDAAIKKSKLSALDPAKLTGVQPKKESFGTWLKKQSFDTQTNILGTMEKATMFREGKLKYEQFVTQTGKALSLEALRSKASQLTAVFRPRQKLREKDMIIKATKPHILIRSPQHKADLQQLFLLDSDDYNKTLSLTDYKGTSLVGKQASRRRAGNEFDERNFSADPLTGEVKNTLVYDPDFNLLQERLDLMRGSKLLNSEEKDFIGGVVNSLDDKVSVNQQTVITENLRVVLERYAKDKTPWEDFPSVVRAENRFAVQNVSRLLDTRARKKSELFLSYMNLKNDVPKVNIMGTYYSFEDLQKNLLADQRFIDNWRAKEGDALAKRLYFTGRVPMKAYFRKYTQNIPANKQDVIKAIEKSLEKDPRSAAFVKAYKAFKKLGKPAAPTEDWITRNSNLISEQYRRLVDLEFLYAKEKPTSLFMDDTSLDIITNAVKLVASGQSTDYDNLAITIGKMFNEKFKDIIPFTSHTLQDHHKLGSDVLTSLKEQNIIRVQFRGKTRRGVFDVETGRASGGWAETISREVIVIDKNVIKLQEAERRVTIARRIGTVEPRDQLTVKPNEKVFFDARGNKTGIPVISRSKFPDYDPKQIDREIAAMLNHVSNVEYGVDTEFFDFMDDLLRFRDPRGNSEKYDALNEFRHEILRRGEQGYGMMATAKWHRLRGQNFKTQVYMDSRGRVYHRGYLTPTGGELVRPFLNSGKAVSMDLQAIDELRTQLGAMIGPGTEALTQAGRREIFKRSEQALLELGELMMAKTQRDRRLREFLEHPILKGMEGPEVAKLSRMALEYTRVYKHVNGDFSNPRLLSTYKTKLMIENDASSSGAQIIALSTGDRKIAEASNVLATTQKNRLYDLVALDTVNDPEFLAIPALRDANLTWEDLAKAAKAQNMVSFYGAGAATKTANVSSKLSKVLNELGYMSITKDELGAQLRIIDGQIKLADKLGTTTTKASLESFRKELVELVNSEQPIGRDLLKEAMEIHPSTEAFVEKLMNTRRGLISPKDFSEISRIMSKNLALRAPVTDNFITFWKRVAKVYVTETQKVDIPWVTFDGKVMTQRYRPKLQERIEFKDPITGRKIANIYEDSSTDGKLQGKSSISRASIGLGVNGNHSNDAVIVRRFHLWGKDNNVGTGTIHDAFFTNIGDAQRARDALRTIYADALEGDTVRKTLSKMREEGLSRESYNALIQEAKDLGLIDPPNKLTRKDILAPLKVGEDWYGIGP